MSVGKEGLEYEQKVLSVVVEQIHNTNLKLKPATSTAGFSAHEPDLVLISKANNKPINIEIKKDKEAQMGGGSFNYDFNSGKFFPAEGTEIDPEIQSKIIDVLQTKKKSINDLLDYAKNKNPIMLAEKTNGFPLNATKKVWEELTTQRFLVPLNGKVAVDTAFLYKHYRKKNCYYIQIGGSGLYYLDSNPLNLPIPQLRINMNVELRLGRGGSRMNVKLQEQVASGNMRAQGRLNGKMLVASPMSLDIPGHFEKLFGTVN